MKQILFVAFGLTVMQLGWTASAVKLLSTQCEEALALSAIPQRLRSNATVYTLQADGYHISKHGDGAFTCAVVRNHPDSIIPECFDVEGTKTILPSHLRRGEMIQAGLPDITYLEERNQKEKQGEIQPPAKPGVSYMISDYNYIYIAPLDGLRKIPAHMMYYAPYLTDADIGGSMEAAGTNVGLPVINDPGIHGFMIAYVAKASDSSDVIKHCKGQLGEEPSSF